MGSKRESANFQSSSYEDNQEKTFNKEDTNENALSSQYSSSLCSQEKLNLSSWGLPERVLEFYRNKNINQMFPWQVECLTLGKVLNSGNLVYSAPTSAGKTLVAEILISKTVFELQKKALVILPFVSVVREKMFYFQEMYNSSGIHVEGYMGGHSPSIGFKQVHVAVCTIEKANSIINKLLEGQSLQNLGLVVVDELHLLGDPYRGYLLELLLTKLKYISAKSDFKIQIVGMSATLPNLKSLADWLEADLYYTDFRPVPLTEKLKCGTSIFDKKLNKISDLNPLPSDAFDDSENVAQLCLETISNGHSVLIFCPTKVWCEKLADKISLFFRRSGCSKSATTEGTPGWILRNQLNLKKINEVIEHLKMSPVGLDKDLHKTVAYGVAFHHAGLTLDERDIIEGSFRQGSIRVLCATSTLSSGVNLPARRVIIRSPMSFGGLMDILTYRQMIGRAGRMGVDSEGESILICKPSEKTLCQALMSSNLKPIESCLGHGRLSASLKRALLEIVASGIASNPEEVKKYASCTFLAMSTTHEIEDPIQSCIEFLEENEFIRLQENGTLYVPTPLGKACLASSLPPDEGLALFRELQRARRCFVLDTDLHIIYQVTPYSVSEQWSKLDWLNVLNILEGLPASIKRVGEMVGVEEKFLVRVVKGSINANLPENRNQLSIHRRFYTALALQELVNEVPLLEVAEKYDCNKGMLQSLQQSAATYAGMVTEFTKRLGWSSIELIFSQFQERLQFGIQRELCELMRLPLLNAKRARALYDAGFTTLSAVANATPTELENAFFAMAPFQSKKEIAGETTYEKDQRNKLETVWITGKADLSIHQAAELLISESRNILQLELGLDVIQWGRKSGEESFLNEARDRTVNYTIPRITNGTQANSTNVSESLNKTKFSQSMVPPMREQKDEIVNDIEMAVIKCNIVESNVNNKNYIKGTNDSVEIVNEINSNTKSTLENVENIKSVNVNRIVDNNFTNLKECDNVDFNVIDNKQISFYKNENHIVILNESKVKTVKEGEKTSLQQNQKVEVDYFASSFNFDMIPDFELDNKNSNKISEENVSDKNIVKESDDELESSEPESSSSVEILFDSKIHNCTKNLSFSRISEDMFEISKTGNNSGKKNSTPISGHVTKNKSGSDLVGNHLSETKSPDLFSESLTFDTQLGRILDFEEPPGEDAPVQANPSASFNSDDLGFVSDLSPPKLNLKKIQNDKNLEIRTDKKREWQDAGITASFFENGFKSPMEEIKKEEKEEKCETLKRKAPTINSPDLIVDSDDSSVENQHTSKRLKYSLLDNKITYSSSKGVNLSDDDEILPTPKSDKNHLSSVSNIKRWHSSSLRNSSRSVLSRRPSQMSRVTSKHKILNKSNSLSVHKTTSNVTSNRGSRFLKSDNSKSNKKNCDKINIIDICEKEQSFRSFCEELKEQNIIGLALGCRRKIEEKKNIIGARIMKNRKIENNKHTSSKCHYNEIVLDGIAFYWKGQDVYYMPLDDRGVPLVEKINLLQNLYLKQRTLRMFDVREQIKVLKRCTSVLLISSYQDPKVASWLLSESWKEKNFSTLALECLPATKNLTSLLGNTVGYSSPGLLVKSTTSPRIRACIDAFLTYHIVDQQLLLLHGKGLQKAFEQTEMPIMLTLAEMELNGFQLNRDTLLDVKAKLDGVKEALEEKAYALAQQKFSMSSTVAVTKILFKQLGLNIDNIPLTKKRKLPSICKEALEDLANETKHPLPEIILQWRKIRSISSKFVAPLLQISADSTRVFGVSQTYTVTGRISMHEPNLQNIPKDFSLNCGDDNTTLISMRDIFIASEDCVLLSVDYCQIELRMLAHLSQDLDLIRNITDSSDIFVNIAANIYGVSNYEVDGNLRQRAKQTCYGIIYGIGPRALSQQLGIGESDAAELMENFKNKYHGVKVYLEKIVIECREKGYVTTLLGRRRYIPAINDTNQTVRMEGERQAVNTTIQGSAADLVKTAMITWRERVEELFSSRVIAHLVLHLHDELIFEIQKDICDSFAVMLKDTLEHAMELSVPIPVKIRSGPSWGRLQNLEI